MISHIIEVVDGKCTKKCWDRSNPPVHFVLVMQRCKQKYFADQAHFLICKRRKHQRSDSRGHRWFKKLSFSVAERLEALKATVPSITTFSNSTEALIMANHLHEALVNTNSTRGSVHLDFTNVEVVCLPVKINRKRLGFFVDKVSYLLKIFVDNNWHNWPENFFIHQGWFFAWI